MEEDLLVKVHLEVLTVVILGCVLLQELSGVHQLKLDLGEVEVDTRET